MRMILVRTESAEERVMGFWGEADMKCEMRYEKD